MKIIEIYIYTLVITLCIISLFVTLYACKLQDQVAFYKARAEVMETAFDRLRKLTPIEDKSNYPFVTNKKEIDP